MVTFGIVDSTTLIKLFFSQRGMILGAVSGLGLAFFSEYTNEGLSTPEGVERHLGPPVPGTVPYKEEQ